MATILTIYLTNRFNIAVRLFSNRSQMTSKCGKNKKVALEAIAECVLMFLPHFDVFCDLLLNMESICFVNNNPSYSRILIGSRP